MLTQEKIAILGGYLCGDQVICEATFENTITSLFKEFSPNMRTMCLQEYYNYASDENMLNSLHDYLFKLKKTSEDAINTIYNTIFNIKNNGDILSKNDLDILYSNSNVLYEKYNKTENKPENIETIINLNNTAKYYSCGKNVNRVIGDMNKGFESGRSYVFSGPAKGGKSLFLQNLAINLDAYNKCKILYISLENNIRDIGIRQLEIKKNLPFQNPLNFDVLYEPKLRLADIENYAQLYDIIIVDYLARIIPDSDHEKLDNYTLFGYFADELHKIAEKNDIVIITASQLNRSALSVFKNSNSFEDNFMAIDQDNLADSMGIVRNSDSVSVIWKHEGKFYIHNIASRVKTDNEAVALNMNNYQNDNNTIAISLKGFVIC